MQRKWQIAKKITKEFKSQFPEINPLVLQLLCNRGMQAQEAIDEFLNPDYGQDLHDPFLFREMKKAVARVFLAVEKKEKITVHGDYDADGVCSTAIVVSTLKALGADVDVYIPHRVSEGYGLNVKTVKELHKNGTNLIVTVDCGVSNYKEVALANERGMTVIVTDHHEQPPNLPDAFAIVNPHLHHENYPFKELAGSGVAFKFAQALVKEDAGKKLKNGFEKWLLDLVALGTIADCVPLTGENRTLAKYGLVVLRKTRRLGLQALVKSTRYNLETLDTESVSFGIVPRLNAAGRIDHANTAFALLMTDNELEAEKVAFDLEATNQQRQRITEKILTESDKQIGEVKDKKILFAFGADWSVGIVGLVAGRLMDKYARPVIIMGGRGDEIVGSGRSIPEFDITRGLIDSSEFLDRFGGHAAACGFTLKKGQLESFKKKISQLAEDHIKDSDMINKYAVDCEIFFKDTNWDLVQALESFEPFGEGNQKPCFAAFGLELVDLQKVGNDGKHLRLNLKQDGVVKKVIAFGFGEEWGSRLKINDKLDILFELSVNEWNGNRELQLRLVDLKLTKP